MYPLCYLELGAARSDPLNPKTARKGAPGKHIPHKARSSLILFFGVHFHKHIKKSRSSLILFGGFSITNMLKKSRSSLILFLGFYYNKHVKKESRSSLILVLGFIITKLRKILANKDPEVSFRGRGVGLCGVAAVLLPGDERIAATPLLGLGFRV